MEQLISWLNKQWNSRSCFIFNGLYIPFLFFTMVFVLTINKILIWDIFPTRTNNPVRSLLMRFHDWFSLSYRRDGITDIEWVHRVRFFSLWSVWMVDHWLNGSKTSCTLSKPTSVSFTVSLPIKIVQRRLWVSSNFWADWHLMVPRVFHGLLWGEVAWTY